MRTRLLKLTAALLLLAPVMGTRADVSFAYNGLLLDATGQLLSVRNHSILFRIYDQATGGSPLWNCTRSVVLDEKGQFSVELSGNSISGGTLASLFAANSGKTLYLGLTVDGEESEILPRQRLMSVPKAVKAEDGVAARGDFVAIGDVCVSKTVNVVEEMKVIEKEGTENALEVQNALEVRGKLQAGSMTVNGNMVVASSPDGSGGVVDGKGVIPVGGIVIWHGTQASIPNGWALCNGQKIGDQPTPDLRDRFIVGASGQQGGKGTGNEVKTTYRVGNTGGENEVTLGVQHLPSHTHSYSFNTADIAGLAFKERDYFYSPGSPYNLTHAAQTDSVGGNQPHGNLPPYYALCYIMRVK